MAAISKVPIDVEFYPIDDNALILQPDGLCTCTYPMGAETVLGVNADKSYVADPKGSTNRRNLARRVPQGLMYFPDDDHVYLVVYLASI